MYSMYPMLSMYKKKKKKSKVPEDTQTYNELSTLTLCVTEHDTRAYTA